MGSYLNTSSVRDRLTSDSDQQHQFPVHFAYDYLNGGVKYLQRPQLKLNGQFQHEAFLKLLERSQGGREMLASRVENGIDLYPVAAGLPWPCGVLPCRQSVHWKASLDTAKSLVQVFAAADEVKMAGKAGRFIASMARQDAASKFEEGWAKFPPYLYPEADEQRSRLLAVVNVFIFLFDDFWEMNDINSFSNVQKAFIARMEPGTHHSTPTTLVESHIDAAIAEMLEVDRDNNAGREMVESMIRFFNRPPPAKEYKTMDEFLRYRHEDAAVPFVLANIKFSINSSVDLDNPLLARFIHLFKDQVSIANDLGSWEKEKKAWDKGEGVYLINAVYVAKQLLGVSYETAVAMTQSLQYEVECRLDEEVQRLIAEDTLTAVEWHFVYAALLVISGNIIVSTISSRYGGDGTKLL